MAGDIFREVRERLDMDTVARFYGYAPNRGHFIRCPFHAGDHTASLKLYPGAGGWHCFGCNRGGSVIDFVAQLFGLELMGAVRKLDADFNLHIPLDRPPSREEREQAQRRREVMDTRKAFEAWRERMLSMLNTAYRVGHLALKDKRPDAAVLAVTWMPALESWADSLDYGDMEAQMMVFRDRKGVERLCEKILNNTLEKSATA